jgi:hypothetical protein
MPPNDTITGDQSAPSDEPRVGPRAFLFRRRPGYFSDTPQLATPRLDRAFLEYYISRLTSRSQETDFETFARRLCEREVCPNLLPHTGPTGGGDSKVDSETYPVSGAIAAGWYVGEAQQAAVERWAFAFSAKAAWRPKLASDVAKMAGTGRGYDKYFFVSSQFIPDRVRAEIEDGYRRTQGWDVRILDLGWLLERVFEGRHEAMAVEALHIDIELTQAPRPGPRDAARASRLAEIDDEITRAVTATQVGPRIVGLALDAANLSRELERPRQEVDGRFERAARLAEQHGLDSQELSVAYENAWTAYWWFEDGIEFARRLSIFEERVLGTTNALDLRRLSNLHLCAISGIGVAWSAPADWLADRMRILDLELARVAATEAAPSTALNAQMLALTLALIRNPETTNQTFVDMATVIDQAAGLAGFAFEDFAAILAELGSLIPASNAFDELHATVIAEVQRRTGAIAAGEMHTDRAVQLYRTDRFAEAIIAAGKALPLLYSRESRSSLLRALDLIAESYSAMALPWAARGSWLLAASLAGSDSESFATEFPRLVTILERLRSIELRLGRLPQSLAVHRVYRAVESAIASDTEDMSDALAEADVAYEAVLGSGLLGLDKDALGHLARLPDLLGSIGLPVARSSLLFALGHEPEVPTEVGLKPGEETVFFDRLRHASGGAQLDPTQLAARGPFTLRSRVLGVLVRTQYDEGSPGCEIAESILAALESMLATALALGVVGKIPEVLITIRRGHFTPFPFRTVDQERQSASVEIAYAPFDVGNLTMQQQADVREALQHVLARVVAEGFQFDRLEEVLPRLFGEEGALARSSNFTGSFVTGANLMGRVIETGMSALLSGTEREFGVTDQAPVWPEVDDEVPTQSPEHSQPERPNWPVEVSRVRHDEMLVESIIDVPLWNEANWKGIGYYARESGPPGMTLLFTEANAAARIWEQWQRDFGSGDASGRVRVAIVTGVTESDPFTYRILIGPQFGNLKAKKTKLVFSTVRRHEMNPESDANLRAFMEAYEATGACNLGIGTIPVDATDIRQARVFGEVQLKDISIVKASDVKPDDFEYIALAPMDRESADGHSTL